VLSSTVRDADGAPYNVNADVVAAAIAGALRADAVAFLSDVPAVRDGTGRSVTALTPAEALALVRDGVADGGMRPKLEAAAEAVASGVGSAVLADGRDPAVWLAAVAGAPVRCTRIERDRADRAATGGR
jgi:acetylglutamate kinase